MSDKQTEALKLALEYLRDNQHYIADNERHAYVMEYNAFVERLEALADHIVDANKMVEQPAQDQGQSCPNCEALTKQVTALKTCLEVERGFREQEQPAISAGPITPAMMAVLTTEQKRALLDMNAAPQPAQEPVSTTDELVDAYCKTWEQSFTADNPYHTVRMTAEDRKHITAGLEAALAKNPAQPSKPWVGLIHEETHEAIGTAGVDLLELAKMWSDNKVHVYQFDNEARKIIEAVLRRASAKLREKNA